MSAVGLPPAVVDRFGGDGLRCLCHVTEASVLPDIAASGGLLSLSIRREGDTRRWGANADIGRTLVCCSFQPHWGTQMSQFPAVEAAILVLDASGVVRLPGARLCPINSAKREARPFIEHATPDPQATLVRCLSSKPTSEVLVPLRIPFELVRFIVFSDETAREAWWPPTRRALDAESKHVKPLLNGALGGYKLPPDFVTRTRVRPVREGVTRRYVDLPAVEVHTPEHELTLAHVEQLFEEAGEAPDLWDELYDEDPYAALRGDFVDWPTSDDEPREWED